MPSIPPEPVVLYQLAMDGAGIAFEDSGPSHLPVTLTSTPAASFTTIDQNSGVTLFGLPTMAASRTANAGTRRYLRLQNNDVFTLQNNMCLEYWVYPISVSGPGTESPGHVYHIWPGGDVIGSRGASAAGSQLLQVGGRFGDISPGGFIPLSLNAWHYVAEQYVAATNQIFCSLDGALVGVMGSPVSVLPVTSYEARILNSFSSALSNRAWSLRMAQVRCTRGNLYGSAAAPVPVAPWPKFA